MSNIEEDIFNIEEPTAYLDRTIIAGIDGGGTQSTLIIMDDRGRSLSEMKGPSINYCLLGITETAERINTIVERGKRSIGMPKSIPFDCLSLTLSGCGEERSDRQLAEMMKEKYPNVATDYYVNSDAICSLRTAVPKCGIVLIAGTGSNALLVNLDGTMITCGGWGHFMGDEGSAFWIAHRACKYVFDDIDGLAPAPKPISYVWSAMRDYFNVTDTKEILPHFYKDFDKSTFAMFAKEIVIGCEKKDPLCLYILSENGRYLAKHIIALSGKAHDDLKLDDGGLRVVCVGSVWKSWDIMKDDFIDEIHESRALDELTMICLTKNAALGSCYLAAEKIRCHFKKPYENNIKVFHRYKRQNYVKPGATNDSSESTGD